MASCQAPSGENIGVITPTPNNGIRYKRHSAAGNEETRQRIVAAFAAGPGGVEKLTDDFLLCGSGCWSRTNKSGLEASTDYIPATSHTPVKGGYVTREGAFVRTAKGRKAVSTALSQMAGIRPTVRPLTQSELETLWAIVPFDLEDPIFVVEAKGHRVVFDFGSSKSKKDLAHVEDLAGIKL